MADDPINLEPAAHIPEISAKPTADTIARVCAPGESAVQGVFIASVNPRSTISSGK